MSAFDFVVGCNGEAVDFVLDERPVYDFSLCVDVNTIGSEYVFITEDGSLIFTTEDGEKFRPDNL